MASAKSASEVPQVVEKSSGPNLPEIEMSTLNDSIVYSRIFKIHFFHLVHFAILSHLFRSWSVFVGYKDSPPPNAVVND